MGSEVKRIKLKRVLSAASQSPHEAQMWNMWNYFVLNNTQFLLYRAFRAGMLVLGMTNDPSISRSGILNNDDALIWE